MMKTKSIPPPMHVVDCGSGWTRFETYSVHADDGLIHLDHRCRKSGIHDVVTRTACRTKMDAVATVVAAVIPGGNDPPKVSILSLMSFQAHHTAR